MRKLQLAVVTSVNPLCDYRYRYCDGILLLSVMKVKGNFDVEPTTHGFLC
jgi:hypothetical protein